MRWEGREGSDNVDDRRGKGGAAAPVMGGGILVLIIGALITYLSGGNPLQFLAQQAQNQGQQAVGIGDDQQAGPRGAIGDRDGQPGGDHEAAQGGGCGRSGFGDGATQTQRQQGRRDGA